MSQLAKKLRQSPTLAEARLWQLLFPLRSGAYHFRKQAPIGPYIADFACHHARLVIEVDGDSHFTPAGLHRDATRDRFLTGEGYKILHFTNEDVLENPDGVYSTILAALETAHAG